MEADKSELREIVERLQEQTPRLIAALRGLKPEQKAVENIDALIVLKTEMGLLEDLLIRADPKDLIGMLECSKLGATDECLAVYGALAILSKHYAAGAREWVGEVPLMGQ
jgi:hypothetical protein